MGGLRRSIVAAFCAEASCAPHGAARPAVPTRASRRGRGGVEPSVRLHHVLRLARVRLPRTICNAFIPHCRPSPGPAASRGGLLISFTRVTCEVLVGNRARQAPRGTQHRLPLRVIHEHRTLRPTFARVA